MDSLQSKNTQQTLKEKGFNTDELRVDINIEPYGWPFMSTGFRDISIL